MSRRAKKTAESPTPIDPQDVQEALEIAFPDGRWLGVLELFLPTGVADVRQIQTTAGLSRSQVVRLLNRFGELTGKALLAKVPFNVPRPGVRGRAPVVYKLGKVGATLLRAHGHQEAHSCGLTDLTPIAHAQATLDVRLVALAADLHVQTECKLPYDGNRVLRPDNLVTLPDGVQAIFETEQAVGLAVLRRVVESVRRKATCFQSGAMSTVSPSVRVLINLPRGPQWDRTVQVWERATAIVAQDHGDALPFPILAMPLADFLAQPDWAEPPDQDRWESLFDPAQTATFGLTQRGAEGQARDEKAGSPGAKAKKTTKPARRTGQLPASLEHRSARDDRLILLAFWQHFQEQAPTLGGDQPLPDPVFFDLMHVIYAASNDPNADVLAQATHPYASIYLLRQYLKMHSRLCQALSKTMVRGSGSMRWSSTAVLHRMQVVIRAFLSYHNWAVSPPLQAYPVVASWKVNGPRDLGVEVRIRPELLMAPGDGVVPGEKETQQVEEALAWVLWALFAYGYDVGLKPAVFW